MKILCEEEGFQFGFQKMKGLSSEFQCGSEFQMWGPKVGFSACGCQKKSVEYETECRHVAVQRDKQDLIVDTGCS